MRSEEPPADVASELMALLSEASGREHPNLDFKLQIGLETKAQKAEFAKDVALQANLESGGSLVYGVDNDGRVVGLSSLPSEETLANILANRLQFIPPGIALEVVKLAAASDGRHVSVLWVRVPPTRFEIPAAFQAADNSWKMPVRLGTTTRYLSPIEAASFRGLSRRDIKRSLPFKASPLGEWAEADQQEEIIETNLLPITRIPNVIWTAKCSAEDESGVRIQCGGPLPPFRAYEGRIWSLRRFAECQDVFRNVVPGEGSELPMDAQMRRRDSRRRVVGLINSEVSSYLQTLGLVWDPNRSRAYFPPLDGKPREIVWQSFQRRATRTVVGVRRRPNGSVDHWYHFAVRPRVEDLRERVALAISPTWVFTKDGVEQLRSYWVAPIATRRINREDNARILYNIQFWAQYFSQGKPTVDLPTGGGGLSISSNPVTLRVHRGLKGDRIEVPEPPEIPDDDVPPIEWSSIAEEGEDEESDGSYRWS